MTEAKLNFRPARRHLILLAVFVVALYVLLPQFGAFQSSWQLLRRPDLGYSLVAVAFTSMTYVAGAFIYKLLAFQPLPYGRTLGVQLAAAFISRLLPAGIGALGANYMYLRHQAHSVAQAASVVAINNPLGFLGHSLIVAITLLIFSDQSLPTPAITDNALGWLLKIVFGAILLVLLAVLMFGRNRLRQFMRETRLQLISYRRRPGVLAAALVVSMGLTLCNVLCLLFCLLALGVNLPFVAVLLVMTVGVGVGSVTPTPGGLGGVEAGLVAGLLAYGVESAAALAAVLLYRLLSYWLPLIAGGPAFVICERRHLFNLPKNST